MIYSAKSNQKAMDGDGRNSPFTASLKKRLKESGSILSVVTRVIGDVKKSTSRRQTPWMEGSLDRPLFLLAVSSGHTVTTSPVKPPDPVVEPLEPIPGTILVRSTPAGAEVFLNGDRPRK